MPKKKKKVKQTPLPMKFNPGLHKFEPALSLKEKGTPPTKKQKRTKLIKLLIVFAIIIIATILITLPSKYLESEEDESVGGQRDSQGCLGPAGYRYDSQIKACIRPWELQDQENRRAAQVAVNHIKPYYSLTITEVLAEKCPGCFTVKLTNQDNQQITVKIRSWRSTEIING